MPRLVEADALTTNDLEIIRSVQEQCRENNLGRLAKSGPCREFAMQYLDMDGVVDLDTVWAEREARQDAANAERLIAIAEQRA